MAQFVFKLNGQEVSEPVGWDEVSFNVIRSNQHGIDQPWTNSVTFTGDIDKEPGKENGARILRLAWENDFINASVDVEIIGDFKYQGEQWSFVGKIDFATYEEINICNGCSDGVSVEILEDDFRDNFRRRTEVEIDLFSTVDLDGNEIGGLDIDTIRLHCQQLYLVANAKSLTEQTEYILSSGPDVTEFSYVIPTYWINSDFKNDVSGTFNVTGSRRSNTNVIFKNNSNFTRTITINSCGTWRVNSIGQVGAGGDIKFQVFAKVFEIGNYGVGTLYNALYITPFCPVNETDTTGIFEFQLTAPVPANYGIVLQWGYFNTGGWSAIQTDVTFFDDISIKLTEINESAFASPCFGMYVQDFLRRIVAVMTGDGTRLKSDYFSVENQGCQWNNFITTGLFIRNAQTVQQLIDGCGNTSETGNQYAIKTTWKKAFEELSKIFTLGWEFEPDGYNGYFIRVEPVEYYYVKQVAKEFTDVPEIKRYALKEKIYNSITMGYSDRWKNIQLSGIFAIHTERNYFVNNKTIEGNSSNKLDLRSDIITEGYCIEANRRFQFLENNSGSSDRPNDYDLFLIWLNRESLTVNPIQDSGYAFPGETGPITFPAGSVSYASNFIGSNNSPIDRIYNVLHTPARVAARAWKWIGQNAFGLKGNNYRLKYQSGQYFTTFQMAVPDPCGEITDGYFGEDFDIDDESTGENFPGVLVQPIGYEITVPQEICDFLETAKNGKQLIKFSCGSSVFVGYILKGENRPSGENGGLSTYTLIGSEIPVNLRSWGPQFGPQFG